MQTLPFALPDLSRKIEISLGTNSEGREVVACLFTRHSALTRANLPQHLQVIADSQSRLAMRANEEVAELAALLAKVKGSTPENTGATSKKGRPSKQPPTPQDSDTIRYAQLDAALLNLGNDLEAARAQVFDSGSLNYLEAIEAQAVVIERFKRQVTAPVVIDPDVLKAELDAQTAKTIAVQMEETEIAAKILANVVQAFRFDTIKNEERIEGQKIPATVENLSAAFSTSFLQQAFQLVRQDAEAPLVLRG